MSGIVGTSPNMRSGVLGAFPAGHVLNIKHEQVSGTTASFSTGTADTNVTITLTSADYAGGSKIYVWAEYGVRYTGWGTRMKLIRSAPGSDVILSDNYISIAAFSSSFTWER